MINLQLTQNLHQKFCILVPILKGNILVNFFDFFKAQSGNIIFIFIKEQNTYAYFRFHKNLANVKYRKSSSKSSKNKKSDWTLIWVISDIFDFWEHLSYFLVATMTFDIIIFLFFLGHTRVLFLLVAS